MMNQPAYLLAQTMPILPVLHQYDDDPPQQIFRDSINQGMNPDAAKLRKRKFSAEEAEDSRLPLAKHKCCDPAEDSLFRTPADAENVSSDMDVLDTQVDSAQDSNSSPGDSQLYAGVKTNTHSEKTESYTEASTSWCNSSSAESYSQSTFVSGSGDVEEEMMLTGEGKYPHLDGGWDDADFLNECVNAGSTQQRNGDLEEFLSSSGMNPNLYVLSSEGWSVDQETQSGRSKPTIDQEFEQYFSMLML